MMEFLLLLWEFFKIGLFSVGGGMATIPFLMRMSRQYPHWFTLDTLADMIAVSESTPGPIGANMSTYVGFTVFGPLGAVFATLALTLPSFITIMLIAGAYKRYRENKIVDACFRGLRPAVTGMILAAGLTVGRMALMRGNAISPVAAIIFVLLFALMQIKKLPKLHPVAYIAIAALAGIVFRL